MILRYFTEKTEKLGVAVAETKLDLLSPLPIPLLLPLENKLVFVRF